MLSPAGGNPRGKNPRHGGGARQTAPTATPANPRCRALPQERRMRLNGGFNCMAGSHRHTVLSGTATFDKDSGDMRAVIETPKGSCNKYRYDPHCDCFELATSLPQGMAFPFDFGFVPSTLGDDGDPLDVLVLMREIVCSAASSYIGGHQGIFRGIQQAARQAIRGHRRARPAPCRKADQERGRRLCEKRWRIAVGGPSRRVAAPPSKKEITQGCERRQRDRVVGGAACDGMGSEARNHDLCCGSDI